MPLPNRVIRNELDVVDGELYATFGVARKPMSVLQDVGEAKLLGSYEQISLVGSYAAQIFQDIVRDIDEIHARAERSLEKSEQLVAAVAEVSHRVMAEMKKTVKKNIFSDMHERINYTVAKPPPRFNNGSRNAGLKSQYDAITYSYYGNPPVRSKRTPDFLHLSEVLPPQTRAALGSTAQREWSNPQYFVEIWLQEEKVRQEKASERRRLERQKRREAKRLTEKSLEGRGGGATRAAAIQAIKGGQIKSWQERHEVSHLVSPSSAVQRRKSQGTPRLVQSDDFRHVVRFAQSSCQPSPPENDVTLKRSPSSDLSPSILLQGGSTMSGEAVVATGALNKNSRISAAALTPTLNKTATSSGVKDTKPFVLSEGLQIEIPGLAAPVDPPRTSCGALLLSQSGSEHRNIAGTGVVYPPAPSNVVTIAKANSADSSGIKQGSVRHKSAALGSFLAAKLNPAPRSLEEQSVVPDKSAVETRRSVAKSDAASALASAFAKMPGVGGASRPSLGSASDYAPFRRMLQMHVPVVAVRAKAEAAGFDSDLLFHYLDYANNPALREPARPSADRALPPEFAPFQRMLKMHVPEGAVLAKMSASGLDPGVLLGNKSAEGTPSATSLTQSVGGASGDAASGSTVPSAYMPFRRMLKLHVPVGAVLLKLEAAGLEPSMLGLLSSGDGVTAGNDIPVGHGSHNSGSGFLGDIQNGASALRRQSASVIGHSGTVSAVSAAPRAGGLMAEILAKQGGGLRTVGAGEMKFAPKQEENPLIAAIRKGKTLRKVEESAKQPHRPTMSGGFSSELVQKMLERRGAVESSDSGGSDDDGAWD